MKKFLVPIFYWTATTLFLLLAIYWHNYNDAVFDINIHDTYYVIHNAHASILLAVIYAFLGLIYWIAIISKIKINSYLTQIHSIITLSIIPIYFIGYYILEKREQSQFPLFDDTLSLNNFLFIIWLVFILSQLILVVNIFISLIKFFIKKKY